MASAEGVAALWRLLRAAPARDDHAEQPWRGARGELPEGARCDAVITDESMRRFFRSEYERHCRRWGIDPATLDQSIRDARAGNLTELQLPRRGGREKGRPRAVAG